MQLSPTEGGDLQWLSRLGTITFPQPAGRASFYAAHERTDQIRERML